MLHHPDPYHFILLKYNIKKFGNQHPAASRTPLRERLWIFCPFDCSEEQSSLFPHQRVI